MLNEHDPPKDKASEIATRKWKNNDVRRRIIEAKQRPKVVDPNREPEIAETIINEGRRDGPVKRFERQFIKDMRAVFDEYRERNSQWYLASLHNRKIKLLKEKLRRLKAAQQGNMEVGK
jgi:hypothetical protein